MHLKEVVDLVFGINLFINASLFIPQAWRLFKKKDAGGSSLLTFGGFNFIQLSGIANGYYDHDHALMYGYISSFMTCGSVTLLTIYYRYFRKPQNIDLACLHHEQDSEHLLSSIIQKLPYHVFWKDTEGRYLGCNELQAESAGFTIEEMIGKTTKDFPWKEAYDVIRSEDLAVMENDEVRSMEEEGIKSDGSRVTYLTTRSPLKNVGGEIIGTLGIAVDITAEKQRAIAEEKVKLSNLLAATIAHELRTPLASIGLLISSLEDYLPLLLDAKKGENDKGLSDVQIQFLKDFPARVKRVLHTAHTFIEMMLFQVKDVGFKINQTTVNFSDFMADTIKQYPFQKEEQKLIRLNIESDIEVAIDVKLVTHVFFNLFKNALFAIKQAGKGDIVITAQQVKDQLNILFEDTGSGIEDSMLNTIFEPFTSNKHHGNGIGLAFCRKVVRAHGGEIHVASVLGEFTRFSFSLDIKSV